MDFIDFPKSQAVHWDVCFVWLSHDQRPERPEMYTHWQPWPGTDMAELGWVRRRCGKEGCGWFSGWKPWGDTCVPCECPPKCIYGSSNSPIIKWTQWHILQMTVLFPSCAIACSLGLFTKWPWWQMWSSAWAREHGLLSWSRPGHCHLVPEVTTAEPSPKTSNGTISWGGVEVRNLPMWPLR